MSATIIMFDLADLPAIPDEKNALLQLLDNAIDDRMDRGESTKSKGAATTSIQAVLDGLIAEFGTLRNPKGENVWTRWWPTALLDGRYLVLDVDFRALSRVLSHAERLCRGSSVMLADLQNTDSVVYAPKHAVFFGDNGVAELRKALGVIETPSESEVIQKMAELSGLENGAVSAIFDAMLIMTIEEFSAGGSGKLKLPHIGTLIGTVVPATPARTGINPFTNEKTKFKAKPATVVVKMRPHPELRARLLSERAEK